MKQRPILFSTPMVQAILEGRKTQTRRIVKGIAAEWLQTFLPSFVADPENKLCPYGQTGDILYVRETWQYIRDGEDSGYVYKASQNGRDWEENSEGWTWKPSLFMPKAAARIFLRIADIRVECLQDISEEDAKAEGAERGILRDGPNTLKGEFQLELNNHSKYKNGFQYIWQSINGTESWQANPWVWVVSLEKVEKPVPEPVLMG